MNEFRFEDAAIVRLGEIISRLNSVLEKKVLEAYTSKEFSKLSNEEIVDYVYSNRYTLDDLANARNARAYYRKAKEVCGWTSVDAYLCAAHYGSIALSRLSYDEDRKIQCKISVSPALKTALKKAENSPLFKHEADKVLNFVFTTPGNGWGWEDMTHHNGTKKFGLVKTEKNFKKLLTAGYKDITGDTLGRIRIAFKYVVEIRSHSEKENIIDMLSEALLYTKDATLIKAVDLLYPDCLYHGEYKIFIPDVQ